jgi:hypothetical protein
MAGPVGVLLVGPAASTTEVEEDVDGWPLEALSAALAVSTTKDEKDIDGGPLGGASGFSSVHH